MGSGLNTDETKKQSTLLAVDPGVHACGCALFRDGKLVAAEYVREEGENPLAVVDNVIGWCVDYSFLDKIVIEIPQVYAGPRANDPNDLIQVALVAGAIGALANSDTCFVHPREWKGQLPKPKRASDPYIVAERAAKKLSTEELERVSLPSAKGLQHNVWDAIGLGLWALDR